MIIHPVKIALKPKQKLILIPLGDNQSEEETDRLEALVKWCVEKEKEGHLVRLWGMGDYFETFSPSERAGVTSIKGGYGLHDTTQKSIDKMVQEQADRFVGIMRPVAKNVLGLLHGHHKHDWFFPQGAKRGLNTDIYLCNQLGCTYFGTIVVLRLCINGLFFTVFATHGYGSARTKGARLNKRLRMREVYLNANWYVMGHDNEKLVDVDEPMIFEDGEVIYLKQYFTGSGAFQKSYSIGEPDGGYAEQALYPPASLGVVVCNLQIDTKRGKPRLDYHISS